MERCHQAIHDQAVQQRIVVSKSALLKFDRNLVEPLASVNFRLRNFPPEALPDDINLHLRTDPLRP